MADKLTKTGSLGWIALFLFLVTVAIRPSIAHAQPQGHPGGGHGGGGRQNMGFQPPDDGADNDPSLPPGTLSISIRNADDIPLAGVEVTLGILHSSVARGDSRDSKKGVSDENGTVTFADLEVGAAHSYKISSNVGPGTFELPNLQLSDKSGMSGVLHLYDVTEDMTQVRVFMGTHIEIMLKEDAFVIRQSCGMINLSKSAWLAEAEIPLPEKWKAFDTADDTATAALKVMPTAKGAVLKGTVPPGRSSVTFTFQVPLAGEESQAMLFNLFPNTLQTELVAEASKKMRLVAEGFQQPKFDKAPDGRSILTTTHGIQEPQIDHFKATISGLPTRGPGGIIAAILGGIAVAGAFAYRLARAGKTDLSEDSYLDLIDARETLLGEIAELERAHRRGTVGPKSYARLRALLTDALSRILVQLEQADRHRPVVAPPEPLPTAKPSAKKKKKKPAVTTGHEEAPQ